MISLDPNKDEEHSGLRPKHISEDVQPPKSVLEGCTILSTNDISQTLEAMESEPDCKKEDAQGENDDEGNDFLYQQGEGGVHVHPIFERIIDIFEL